MRKRVFVAAAAHSTFYGSGRAEFNPRNMPSFETYLQQAAAGTLAQVDATAIDEGIIGSFMSGRFLKQANLPGFLPFLVPSLLHKPCTAVEGACGTGGRALGMALRSVLSDLADAVFVIGFEAQNQVKAVYGADILAGAAYYRKERKQGAAHFFPGLFSERAGAYYKHYGKEKAREGMVRWYEQMILNARQNPLAQEYHNQTEDLSARTNISPNPNTFLPHLTPYDCSKVTDGASSLLVLSEEGIQKCGLKKTDVIEIVGIGEVQADLTKSPDDLACLSTTEIAAKQALMQAKIGPQELALVEIHDCFTITALLALEAIGACPKGEAADYILGGNTQKEGKLPCNLSGGLGGFGHPTGATGIRQMGDLLLQCIGRAENQASLTSPHGLMVSMGGNDKTVTALVTQQLP